MGSARCTAINICLVDDKVVLVIETPNTEPVVAVMSAREARRLQGRLMKAANDASAAAARGAVA